MRYSIVCLLLLTACHDKRPPAPTAEQNEQLNEMESALNAMGKGEGPEDSSVNLPDRNQ